MSQRSPSIRQQPTNQSCLINSQDISAIYIWVGALRGLIGLTAFSMCLAVGCQESATVLDVSQSPTLKTPVVAQPKTNVLEKTSKPQEELQSTVVATTASVQPHPRNADLNDFQLNKSHTLFVLAFDSTTRHKYFFTDFQLPMTPPQIEQFRDLVDSHNLDFAKLRDQRAAILETAGDGQDVDVLLRNNRIETVLLSRKIRSIIFREVLTKEQQQQHRDNAKAQSLAKQQRNQSSK